MQEINKDKVVMALRCNLNFADRADCSACAYSCSKSTHISVQANLLADALALIEKQAEQLKEWQKYAGFLYAHGFFRDAEEVEHPLSAEVTAAVFDQDGNRVSHTKWDGKNHRWVDIAEDDV